MRDRVPPSSPQPRHHAPICRSCRSAGSALLAGIVATVLLSAAALAQPPLAAGPELLVSAGGTFPAIAAHSRGTGVIAWVQPGSAMAPLAIRARRYAGEQLGVPFQVNAQPASDLRDPQVAMDGQTGFLVVWSAREVRGQLFRGDGRRRGGELTLSPRNASAAHPEVAMAADGRFALGWEQSSPDPKRAVRLATFTAGGGRLGRPLTMAALGVNANLVGAVSASPASVAVGWTEFTPCPSNPIDPVSAVAVFNWSLAPLREVDRLANDNPCVDGPQVLAMPNSELGPLGIFVGRRYSIQRFSPVDGTRIGPRTNVAELPACDANACERVVAVAGDPKGRFVFVWETLSGGRYELSAELYGREGLLRSDRFPVSAAPSSAPQRPVAALLGNGTLVVAWQRAGEGIVMRRFGLP